MVATISKAVTDSAAEIINGLLVKRYNDTMIFDPIVVIPEVDDYDRERCWMRSGTSNSTSWPYPISPNWGSRPLPASLSSRKEIGPTRTGMSS